MYLHSRNCEEDFVNFISKNRDRFSGGVVHSYTGTDTELKRLLDMDLYIGVNGCSLKTEENLENVKKIPLDRLMIETDAPYCEIRNTHASRKYLGERIFKGKRKEKYNSEFLVKGRNEPCKVVEVLEVLSKLRGEEESVIAKACFENSCKLFNVNKK